MLFGIKYTTSMLYVVFDDRICRKTLLYRDCRRMSGVGVKLRRKEDSRSLMLRNKELNQVELELSNVINKYTQVKGELESLYVTMRCEKKEYNSDDSAGSGLIAMSRTADDYIQLVYKLENRRIQLLQLLGSGN